MKLSRALACSVTVALVAALVLATVAVGAATRRPNLTVTRSVVPAHLEVGTIKTINVTVKNSGAASAAATTVKLTLSSTRAPGRTILGSSRVGALAAGATATVPVVVTVPSPSAMGNKYVVACADPGARITETVETDNCRSASTHVM